jgi:ATP-dependent HslUV protease ATP-binding subunit HslU
LTEPNCSLTQQYQALLGVEGIQIAFSTDGIKRLAELAFEVNETTENIGARRLHTLMERLLEDLSFTAAQAQGAKVVVNQVYVEQNLQKLVKDQDLSQYIL